MSFKLKRLADYPAYSISEDGFFYSHVVGRGKGVKIDYSQNKKLKLRLNNSGYFTGHIKHKTLGFQSRFAHITVCEEFHGNKPTQNHTASHKNGIRTDNRAGNLCWETYSENLARRKLHGTDDTGVNNTRAKINKIQLNEIRELLKEGKLTHEEIGKKFNLNRVFITKINCGMRYNGQ